MASVTFTLLYAFLDLALFAQQRTAALTATPAKPVAAVRTLDKLPLPADAVIVIIDGVKNALDRVQPAGVLLSSEQFQATQEELTRLRQEVARMKRQQAADKGEALIDTCILRGQVVADSLNLQVELKFKTNIENALVPMGFKGVKLTNATLDGETPVWGPYLDGYTLRVKEAKVHQLILDMRLKVARADADRSVFLDLPQAAITKLDVITIPERVEGVLINKAAGVAQIEYPEAGKSLLRADALGVLDRLELTWQAGAAAGPSAPRVNTVGDFKVSINEGTIETEAVLNIETRRGAVSMLRFRLTDPGRSRVSAPEVAEIGGESRRAGTATAGSQRRDRFKGTFDSQSQILTLSFDPPLTPIEKPFPLRVRFQQPHVAKSADAAAVPQGAVAPLGVLELLDLPGATQRGTITVWRTPGVGVEFQTQTLTPIDPSDLRGESRDERMLCAAFRFTRQPVQLAALVTALQPVVEATGKHVIQVSGRALALTSEFELDVSRAGIGEIIFDWPKGMRLEKVLEKVPNPNLVETWRLDNATSKVHIMLRPQRLPLKTSLEMQGVQSLQGATETTANLPSAQEARRERGGERGVPVQFRGGEVTVKSPDNLDVRLQPESSGLLRDQDQEGASRLLRGSVNFRLEPKPSSVESKPPAESPWRVALAWQPRQPHVENQIRLFLTQRELQVRQMLRYDFSDWTPAQVWVSIPAGLEGLLHAQWVFLADKDWKYANAQMGTAQRRPPIPARRDDVEQPIIVPEGRKGPCQLILEYHTELPALVSGQSEGNFISIALVWPVRSLVRNTHARFWTSAAIQVQVEGKGGWEPISKLLPAAEEIGPQLELRSVREGAELRVRRTPAAETPFSEILADRVLLETAGTPDGKWQYHARFWLSRIRSDQLQVLLPGTARKLLLEKVLLDQDEVPRERLTIVEKYEDSDQTLLQITVEPRRLSHVTLLDVRFQLERGADAPFVNARTLPAPELLGRAVVGRVRWRIELPAERFPLFAGGEYAAEQPWQFRGALVAPQPTLRSGEMEEWLVGATGSSPAGEARPAFLFTRLGSLHSLRIVDAPERSWLLACSFLVLVPGVLLYCFPLRRPFGWAVFALAILAALGLLVPDWLWAIAYGAQPGLVVLAAMWLLMWLRQRRWQRQVLVLPGFSRMRTESSSSVIRPPSSVARAIREPSTVDAPKSPGPTSSELRAGAAKS